MLYRSDTMPSGDLGLKVRARSVLAIDEKAARESERAFKIERVLEWSRDESQDSVSRAPFTKDTFWNSRKFMTRMHSTSNLIRRNIHYSPTNSGDRWSAVGDGSSRRIHHASPTGLGSRYDRQAATRYVSFGSARECLGTVANIKHWQT